MFSQRPDERVRRMRLGLVDEDEDQVPFLRLLARRGEDLADHALGLAEPHVQDLRAVDVHEVLLHILPGPLAVLLRQVVGGRLADQRLAAAGRAVEQDALERPLLEPLEELRVEQRQLDGVLDDLDDLLLAADLVPGQVRNLFQEVVARLLARESAPAPP